MVVSLAVRIKKINPPEIKKRLWNEFMRDGLREVGEYWVANYLPRHFEPSAYQRYQYAARNALYTRIKARATRVRPWMGTQRMGWVPSQQPPRPWVWSGLTRETLLGKSPSDFNIRPVATSKKQTVTVKLPIPHPISKDHSDELGRLNKEELDQLCDIAFNHIVTRLNQAHEEVSFRLAA